LEFYQPIPSAELPARGGLQILLERVISVTEYGVEGQICIHALYSMLPAVFAMLFDAHFPWLDNPDVKTHACPDAHNPVVFEISRIRKA
jgi:uncharacterized repeat protein (TIGR04076 family)